MVSISHPVSERGHALSGTVSRTDAALSDVQSTLELLVMVGSDWYDQYRGPC